MSRFSGREAGLALLGLLSIANPGCQRAANTISGPAASRQAALEDTGAPRMEVILSRRHSSATSTPTAPPPIRTAQPTAPPEPTSAPTATPTPVPSISIALRGIPWQWDFYSVPGQPDGGAIATLRLRQSYKIRVFNDAPAGTAPHYFSGIASLALSGGILGPGDSFTQILTPEVAGDFPFLCTDSSCGIGHDRMTGLIHVVP